MLQIIIINFLIACIGFGSGTVFMGYVYDAYGKYTTISTNVLDISAAVAMTLPAPFTPKMLGLIAYQEYGFWVVWPAVIAFIIPTIVIASLTFKHYSKFKNIYFFKQLSKFFPPLMAAITLYIIITLTMQNVQTALEFKYFIVPLTLSLILRYGFKQYNSLILILVNVLSLIIIV